MNVDTIKSANFHPSEDPRQEEQIRAGFREIYNLAVSRIFTMKSSADLHEQQNRLVKDWKNISDHYPSNINHEISQLIQQVEALLCSNDRGILKKIDEARLLEVFKLYLEGILNGLIRIDTNLQQLKDQAFQKPQTAKDTICSTVAVKQGFTKATLQRDLNAIIDEFERPKAYQMSELLTSRSHRYQINRKRDEILVRVEQLRHSLGDTKSFLEELPLEVLNHILRRLDLKTLTKIVAPVSRALYTSSKEIVLPELKVNYKIQIQRYVKFVFSKIKEQEIQQKKGDKKKKWQDIRKTLKASFENSWPCITTFQELAEETCRLRDRIAMQLYPIMECHSYPEIQSEISRPTFHHPEYFSYDEGYCNFFYLLLALRRAEVKDIDDIYHARDQAKKLILGQCSANNFKENSGEHSTPPSYRHIRNAQQKRFGNVIKAENTPETEGSPDDCQLVLIILKFMIKRINCSIKALSSPCYKDVLAEIDLVIRKRADYLRPIMKAFALNHQEKYLRECQKLVPGLTDSIVNDIKAECHINDKPA